MQVSRLAAGGAVLLLSLSACDLLPFLRKSAHTGAAPEAVPSDAADVPAQAVLEWQNPVFDGERLSGRLLVGVKAGQLLLDKRLVENVSVELRELRECVSGQPVDSLEVDSFPAPPRPDKLLRLNAGFWYGADVRFALFDEQLTGKKPPECFEAELQLRAEDGRVAARLHLRARRDVSPDGR